MRWFTAMLLFPMVVGVTAGCATRNWVRETLSQERTQTEARVGQVERRLADETRRVEGEVGTVTSRISEIGTAAGEARQRAEAAFTRAEGAESRAEAVRERAEAAHSRAETAHTRAEAAHSRAEAAHTRAEEVDQRLTRLWTNRHARKPVESLEVTFRFDRADLDDGAQTALLNIVRELQANPGLSVDLIGHTDPSGPREYNLRLSERRVEAVRRFLVQHGIELPRVHALGMGPLEDPKVPNAKKRRVTVRMMTVAD